MTSSWIGSNTPFLSLPMMDAVILGIVLSSNADLIDQGEVEANELNKEFGDHSSYCFTQWACWAYLVQMLIAHCGSYLCKAREPTTSFSDLWQGLAATEDVPAGAVQDSRTVYTVQTSELLWPLLSRILHLSMDGVTSSTLFTDKDKPLESFSLEEVFPSATLNAILVKWLTFIRACSLALSCYRPSLFQPTLWNNLNATKIPSASLITDDIIISTMKLMNLTDFLAPCFIDTISNHISHWIQDALTTRDTLVLKREVFYERVMSALNTHANCRYPSAASPSFFAMSDSYTKLHSSVTSTVGFEAPAICLLCGLILDGSGKGNCTKHLSVCGGDVGVFFLLQDCYVLISHGRRACYLPTPFVDGFGDRHRNYKGKPLKLDYNRLEVLRKMWCRHSIASEVVLKRSSGQKVVIVGYY